ncbi:nitroreductase/quinone reductase family protein [Mycolicibacterium palauense]|uniref:nitroreductase/quinone reductase family protein n=1 Tax=Mycolicibacterium palauense TaxID=2034511 RepID=UPI000BFF08F7|nr:nitroreductase/quinone reductase family protein [Mycolicibacterium palauense]
MTSSDTASPNSFNDAIVAEFRGNGGRVGGRFEGASLLLLHTTGARSGRARLSPLAHLTIDGRMLIIGSYAGAPKDPAWVHNLRADPRAHVEVATPAGIAVYDVTARELPAAERDALYPRITEVAPAFAEYRSKTTRVIPLFELTRCSS